MAQVFMGCNSTRTYSFSMRSTALPCCVMHAAMTFQQIRAMRYNAMGWDARCKAGIYLVQVLVWLSVAIKEVQRSHIPDSDFCDISDLLSRRCAIVNKVV